MVKGLKEFVSFFHDFKAQYALIGGAACDQWITANGLNFRTTKDLDIVLVIEALNKDFVKRFWEYIKISEYSTYQKNSGKSTYYRFIKPGIATAPEMLELFSRKPDVLIAPRASHLTPIPVKNSSISLSAILMDDNYYKLILSQRREYDGIPLISVLGLICLKAKAFLDLSNRKKDGEKIDAKEIKKHKNDIFRLALTLSGEDSLELVPSIKKDMELYLELIDEEPPDISVIARNMGIPNADINSIISSLRRTFKID